MYLSTVCISDKSVSADPSIVRFANRLLQDMTSFFLWPSFEESVSFMVAIQVKDTVQSLSCVIKEAVQTNLSNSLLCFESSVPLSSYPLSGRHRRCRSGDVSSCSVISVVKEQDVQVKKGLRDCINHRSVSCSDLSGLASYSTPSSITSSSTVSSISSPRHSRNATWCYAVTDSESDSDSDISISGFDTDSDDMISKMKKFMTEINAEASKAVDQQMSIRFDCIPELSSAISPVDLSELAQLQGKLCGDRFSFHVVDVDEECDVVPSEKCDFVCSSELSSTVRSVDLSKPVSYSFYVDDDFLTSYGSKLEISYTGPSGKDFFVSDSIYNTEPIDQSSDQSICLSADDSIPFSGDEFLRTYPSGLEISCFGSSGRVFVVSDSVDDIEPIEQSSDQSICLSAVHDLSKTLPLQHVCELRLDECFPMFSVSEEDEECVDL